MLLEPAAEFEIAFSLLQRLGELRITGVGRPRPISHQHCFGLPAIHGVLLSSFWPEAFRRSKSAAIARSPARCAISLCQAALSKCPRFPYKSAVPDRKARAAPEKSPPVARATATPSSSPIRSRWRAGRWAGPDPPRSTHSVETGFVFVSSPGTHDTKS